MSLDTWGGGPPTPAEVADSDAWLWRVLQKDKNKAMIARLENSLRAFVRDDAQTSLPFPPRSAFHRKVCYLVARRYGLAHRLEEYPDAPTGPVSTVRLVLLKTPHSAEPSHTIAQLADAPPPDAVKDPVQRVNPVPVQKVVQGDELSGPLRSIAPSTTFLRRPRSADDKTSLVKRTIAGSTSQSAATLKSISEEDYRKARARIFNNSDAESDGRDQSEQDPGAKGPPKPDLAKFVKIAKGPVEGSTGFERRRNRRSSSQPSESTASDEAEKISTDELHANPLDGTGESSRQPGKPPQSHCRGNQPRNGQDTTQRQNSSVPLAGSSGSASFAQFSSGGGSARRQAAYSGAGNSNGDLQDPDFDRRYDKWAVRRTMPHPPHPAQQIPVPIFSQLLYPYAVQASAPHLHPSAMHLGSVNSNSGQLQPGNGNVSQYPSLQVNHAPSGAVMFQHLGQGIGGLGVEYTGRNMAIPDHMSPYDMGPGEQFGASRMREMTSLQHSAIPPPVARKHSPAYGLDSTVDFPPLP